MNLQHSAIDAPDLAHTELASLLKAAADELRLGVLQVLARDSFGVLELAQVFGVKQSGMSHHLKVLANAGLVTTRREGNSIFYRRAPITLSEPFSQLKQCLYTQADQLPEQAQVRRSLNELWRTRGQTSQQFFIENADKFKAQQDLIAGFEVYDQPVNEMLALTPTAQNHCALEVGPGAGEFLTPLLARFNQVVALDNSQAMLEQAKARFAANDDATRLQFIHGSTHDLANVNCPTFDLAVMNMVLHHIPSPATMIREVSNALATGGALIITELCSHQQTWARENCGDVWLGFAPDDLKEWAQAANLRAGQSVYFALRNGFQIQIQQFFK